MTPKMKREEVTMRARAILLLTVAALLQGCGAVMLRTPCENPRISNLSAPSSYVVMLPYRYGGNSDVNRESALQLNRIATLQALQGAVETDETQITLLEGEPSNPKCGIETVYDRIVESRSGLFWRRPFHSAVFVWGEIFDRDDGLIVQSHMRVLWNGSADREFEVSVDLPAPARPLRFGGSLPAGTISFPAKKFTRADQERLASLITAELQVRVAPRLDAAPVELPAQFMVMDWRRPWLKLLGPDLRSVWLLIDERGLEAGSALPETLLARAMANYLNFRVNGDAESRRQALDSLSRFRAALVRTGDPLTKVPLAVADVIEGTLGLPTPRHPSTQENPTVPVQSQSALANAARALPSNGEVLNLAAISRIPGCCDDIDAAARILEIQNLLERAEALELGNLKIAQNLVNWYSYLATLSDEKLPFTRAQLSLRTLKAKASLSEWSSRVRP